MRERLIFLIKMVACAGQTSVFSYH